MTEEELILRLKQQNAKAFRELVEAFGDHVFNTSLSILQDQNDAEDISQEVFIEVFQSIQKFRGDAKLSTWIYRITLTKSLEFIRKKKRKKRFAFFQPIGEKEHALRASSFYHPGVQLENKERSAILFKAIDRLPEKQKSAFILHKVEGLSYNEIALILNTTLSSVESLLFRAKQNLQQSLSDYYKENY